MKSITILLLILSCSGRPENTVAQKQTTKVKEDEFQLFWMQFREFVILMDTSGIISLTKFPVQTRGSLDSDPIIHYQKREFVSLLNKFLGQSTGTNSSKFEETELDLIRRTVTLSDLNRRTKRVGNMMFDQVNGEWRLVFLFIQLDR